jgi:uncharacterized protein (TIGR00369 family)
MTATPHPRRTPAEQQLLDSALTELMEEKISFNHTLGMKVVSLAHDQPQCRFEMRPDLVGHYVYGRLHGGVISSVLDAMGGMVVMTALAEKHADESAAQVMHRFARLGTIDLRVDFLRQGIGSHFIASAQCTRLGGRLASTQMSMVNNDGVLIATAAAAYMLA